MVDADEAITGAERTRRMRSLQERPRARYRSTTRRDIRASLGAALEERRLLVLLPVVMIIGLTASLGAPFAPDPTALGVVGGLLALALALGTRNLSAFRLAILAAAFWTGFSLLAIHGGLWGTEMLRFPAYGTYQAQVDEVLSDGEAGPKLIVSAVTPLGDARALPIRRVRLALGTHGGPFASGDVISGPIRFYPVPGPALPNGYDGQFRGYFEGIGAYAAATGAVSLVQGGDTAAPARFIADVRRAIAARIDAELPQPEAGIARALITGDQSEITDDLREVMATAGIAHVLAVSGLHMTLVAGGVFAALRLLLSLVPALTRHVPAKRVAAIGGIVAALLYFSISGGNVAALRATVMIGLVFGAVIFGRRALTMRNVAFAALIVLLTDPASAFMPSFQLSFAAVVALIGAWELGQREPEASRGLLGQTWRYFVGLAATSLVAGGATLLFSAYHFQQTSPLGVLGNLLVLPLVGFIMMPAALIAVLLMPFGLEQPLLTTMGWSIARMLDLARPVAALSAGLDASPLLTPTALFIGVLALGWFAFFSDRWRLFGPVLGLPAVLLFGLDRPPDVLIADTTQAVAMRTDAGLRLIAGRPGSFAVRVWEDTYGDTIATAGPESVSCDGVGCLASSPAGFTIALIADPAGFYEDCAGVDLVITRRDAPQGCAAPLVIDAQALTRGGTHWLAWNAATHRFSVRPAISDANRAWRIEGR